MILVFEGVDKSGKTTLAELFPGLHIKNCYIPKAGVERTRSTFKQLHIDLLDFLKDNDNKDYDIILDRSFISELVYSKVMRDYDAFDDPFYLWLSQQYKNLHLFVIFCKTNKAKIWGRILDKNDLEDVPNKEKLNLAVSRYQRFFDDPKIRLAFVTIDTGKEIEKCKAEIDYVVDRLDSFKKMERENGKN